jgi:RimJ/RimL family protein N-acetyltransferase
MRSTSIPFPVIPLSDGTVSLRCRRTSDFDAISDASYDYATRRWLADPPAGEETLAASMARVAEAFATGRSAPLVIADHGTSEPIGLINLQFRDDDVATIAYSVFPAYRGRGVAPRAVCLMAEWAFGALGLTELRLEIDQENAASIRVAQKCAFEPVGHGGAGGSASDGSGKLVFVARNRVTGPPPSPEWEA